MAGVDGIAVPAGVQLAGRLAAAEYRALVRRARVFVAAPAREEYGIAPLEALADGCQLVTAPAAGGYPALDLARQLDPRLVGDDLAGALRIALDDPRADYARRAAELLQAFSREAMDRILARDVLRRLLPGWGAAMNLAAIPSPAQNGFYIGPLFIHAYGLAYVVAVSAAILISRRRWAKEGGDPDLVYEVAMWGFPAGLLGGRIYFLITTPSQIPPHWWGPFAIWKGGLGIWGGIAGGVAGGLWVLHRRLPRADIRRFMDVAAPGLLVAQAIGRVGNYFNQELFGGPRACPGR